MKLTSLLYVERCVNIILSPNFVGSCEVGVVSPLYGMLESMAPLPKGPYSGHIVTGCSGNCKYHNLTLPKLT